MENIKKTIKDLNSRFIVIALLLINGLSFTEASTSQCHHIFTNKTSYAGGTYDGLLDAPIGVTTAMYSTGPGYLRPLVLLNSKDLLGQNILEIGPLYHPTIEPTDMSQFFKGRSLTYWEYDSAARTKLREWAEQAPGEAIKIEPVDLHKLEYDGRTQFDTVIISQVLNYVDFKLALQNILPFIKPGGKLIITNTLKQGDTPFFHPRKPQKAEDIEMSLLEMGLTTLQRFRNEGLITEAEFMANKHAFYEKLVEQNPSEPYSGSEGRSIVIIMKKTE